MNIAIIGAGIAGVTMAWELARDGHQVIVYERHNTTAEEASFAHTGLLSPAIADAMEPASLPWQILRQWPARHRSALLALPLGGAELSWLWQAWRAGRLAQRQQRQTQLLALAQYGLQRLHEVRAELELDFDHSQGLLLLARTEREGAQLQQRAARLRELGLACRELGPEEARATEPALNPATPLHSALQLPQDGAGNCRQFALLLKNETMRHGVRYVFGAEIQAIEPGPAVHLHSAGQATATAHDAVVLCAGADAARLLRPLGLKLPLLPIRGYSVSAAVREPLNAPRSAVLDTRYQVAIARLGNRVRVGGLWQIGGRSQPLRPQALGTLYTVLQDWFPGAAALSGGIQTWQGARATLPDGLPALGASGLPGVWLNLGHGDQGWALSCGCARVLADLLTSRRPQCDVTALQPARLLG
jgi:D-amino-acid dehydrogenase